MYKAEPVDARIRTVKQTQPVSARHDGLHRVWRQVAQDDVAEPAHHRLVGARFVVQLAASVELLVLYDDGQVGHAKSQVQRLGELALVIVLDQKEAGQAVVGLLGRQFVGMRVIPVGAAAVTHREVIVVATAGGNRVARVAVHRGGCVQAVPVDDGGLLQGVVQRGRETPAAFNAQNGVLVSLARVIRLVQQKRRLALRQQGKFGGARLDSDGSGDVKHAERASRAGHEKFLLKVGRVYRVERIVFKRSGHPRRRAIRAVRHPGGTACACNRSHACKLKQLSSL